ncbi:unnamed protein product [Closterium sp. NIES-53]
MAELLASPGRQRDGHFSLRSRIQELWQQREDEEEKKRRENAGGGAKDAAGKAVAGESGDTEQAALNWAASCWLVFCCSNFLRLTFLPPACSPAFLPSPSSIPSPLHFPLFPPFPSPRPPLPSLPPLSPLPPVAPAPLLFSHPPPFSAFLSRSAATWRRAVIEVASDASVADAIHLLSRHGILSAPVRNVDAPADSSWIDRYLGLLDFAGIVLWVLGRVSAGRNGRVGFWGRRMGSVRAGDF